MDASSHYSRPGPRIAEGILAMADLFRQTKLARKSASPVRQPPVRLCVIPCAKQTTAFLQGVGSLDRFLPTERRAQKYPRRTWIGDDFTIIDPSGEAVQAQTVLTELLLEGGYIQPSQVSNCLYSKFRKSLSRNFAHPKQTSNRQRRQKRIYIVGLDDKESVRFAPVRGDLGQELVGRHAS
jgi:hypothetical protein